MLYCRLAEGGLAVGIAGWCQGTVPRGIHSRHRSGLRSRRVIVGFAVGLIESAAVQ
jgi:hypothetical protein